MEPCRHEPNFCSRNAGTWIPPLSGVWYQERFPTSKNLKNQGPFTYSKILIDWCILNEEIEENGASKVGDWNEQVEDFRMANERIPLAWSIRARVVLQLPGLRKNPGRNYYNAIRLWGLGTRPEQRLVATGNWTSTLHHHLAVLSRWSQTSRWIFSHLISSLSLFDLYER